MKDDNVTRKCTKCGLVSPIDDFPVYDRTNGARRYECITCNKSRVAKHHAANKPHRLETARVRYQANPSAHWTPERRTRANEAAKDRLICLRIKVFGHYGSECVCCGETTPKFLTLDHVENDGHKMRKVHGTGSSLYRWLIKRRFPKGFQTLCMNCNFGKARNGGVCPHKEGSTTKG